MAGSWKQTVTNVSEHVFPGISLHKEINTGDSLLQKQGNELLSNLPLQMSLYFNAIFVPVWLTIIVIMLPVKYDLLSDLYKFFVIVAMVTTILNEFVRLYLGYIGNLTEKIPEIAAFWMLSVLLQTPLQLFFLLNTSLLPSVLEYVTQSIMVTFLVIELGAGFFALKAAAKHLAEKFHIAQFQRSNN